MQIPPGDDVKRMSAESARNEKEHEKLNGAILTHHRGWVQLELALSALLYEILRVEPRSSHLAYAIYYSPTGFEARAAQVNNALIQLISENASLAALEPRWSSLDRKINKARTMRNIVAHGAPNNLVLRGKTHVRLTSPAFDVIRMGRVVLKGQIPGIGVGDLITAVERLPRLIECIDD